MNQKSWRGLLAGPFFFALILLLEVAPTKTANQFLAIFVWVVCNWLFSSIPLFVTGLFGVGLSVVFGITSAKEAFAPMADPLIFLFLGGFFFAKAFEVISLDKKIALGILNHPLVRGNLKRTLLAIILLTAFISMWVSNTATTAMMIPLVLGIMKNLGVEDEKPRHVFLLSIAYAATIGGLATPLGSPPNIIALGMLEKLAQVKVNFFEWMAISLPVTLMLIFFLNRFLQNEFKNFIILSPQAHYKLQFSSKDKHLIALFFLTVFLWFVPSLLMVIFGSDHPLSKLFDERLNPGIVSIYLACFLFIFPLTESEKILNQKDALSIDWASLLLFGSGISLGQMLFKVGIADWVGEYLLTVIFNFPALVIIFFITVFTIFFTELASNTATANIIIPLLIAGCLKSNHGPVIYTVACALAANLAFMLPVGTPPNAIVYGTGFVNLKEMMRSGFKFNLISILAITFILFLSSFFFH